MVGYQYEISDITQRNEEDPAKSKVIDSGNGIAKNTAEAKRIVSGKVSFSEGRNWVQLFHHERRMGLGGNFVSRQGLPLEPPEYVIRPDHKNHYHLWLRIYTTLKPPKEAHDGHESNS